MLSCEPAKVQALFQGFLMEITLYVPLLWAFSGWSGEVRTEDLGSSVARGTHLSTDPHVTYVHADTKYITGTLVLCHSALWVSAQGCTGNMRRSNPNPDSRVGG